MGRPAEEEGQPLAEGLEQLTEYRPRPAVLPATLRLLLALQGL